MSLLKVYEESNGQNPLVSTQGDEISVRLKAIGVRFERWQAEENIAADATSEQIIHAYKTSVDELMTAHGFLSVDVINMHPGHPDKIALRQKFLSEHIHADDEVRFFVKGKGLFYIHAQQKVYGLLCEQGDLISVPANTTHWFDMGDMPEFTCIRLFSSSEGWVAQYTGSDIADRFPRFGE